jgi:DNA-binding FrmR family transcriptional regulator
MRAMALPGAPLENALAVPSYIPLQGIGEAYMNDMRKSTVNRLRRIEGQVRGLAQMVEDERYCIDILHQIQAVKSALGKVESSVLKDHAAHCVADAIRSGDPAEQHEKFGELVDLFEKVKR